MTSKLDLEKLITSLESLEFEKDVHSDYVKKALDHLKKIKLEKSKRKLIIFDLNGVLLDREYRDPKGLLPKIEEDVTLPLPTIIGNFAAWKRPDANNKLAKLFENYDIAIWSSAKMFNVEPLVRFMFDLETRSKLKFVWSQENCTVEKGEDPRKPLFIKDLSKMWKEFPEYDQTNTLLIDDSKEKCKLNPEACFLTVKTWTKEEQESDFSEVYDMITG